MTGKIEEKLKEIEVRTEKEMGCQDDTYLLIRALRKYRSYLPINHEAEQEVAKILGVE